MKITIDNFSKNKNIFVDKIVEEAVLFFDCGEYKTGELKVNIVSEDPDNTTGEEAAFYKFSIWKEVYKQIPEALIFLNDFCLLDVLMSYVIHSKADRKELIQYSIDKARERGIEEEYINARVEFINKLAIVFN